MRGRGFLGLPREGGAIGVWVSGVTYGLLYALLWGFDPLLLLLALLGSFSTLLLVDWARYGFGVRRLAAVAIPGLLLGFVAIERIPVSLGLAFFEATLLAVSLGLKGLWRVVGGGGLLGGVGGFVALSSPECGVAESLLPGSYLLMATGFSGFRAVGVRRETLAGFSAGLAFLTLFIIYYLLLADAAYAVLVIVADIVLRILGWVFGVYQSMRLRTYGFLEAARTLIVMALAALLVG